MSGSDLGSSSTSLEKDGDDGGLKEWGREESAELQWCYPSLLNTSMHEDIDGDFEKEQAECGITRGDEEKEKDENERRGGKTETVSIKSPLSHSHIEDSPSHNPQRETRKKVTLMGCDSPLPLSPSKPVKHLLDPNQKPLRSSGLDCGDLDPFVQSDSFVYLAVSARPATQGEVTTVTEDSTYDTKQDLMQTRLGGAKPHLDSIKTQLDQSNPEHDAKPAHTALQKPEEGDFLCTDSFVYLAAPACLLLGPEGTSPYGGRYVYFFVDRSSALYCNVMLHLCRSWS